MSRIPPWVRFRMVLRSFAIQGSWNYETLIGSGFAYTLLPALRVVYGARGERLEQATVRHLELFNSHPYLATIAIGAVSRLEAEGEDPVVIQRFKLALRGSLGSLGDRLFWTAWRPMAILAGLVLFLAGAAWWVAVLAFLTIYNAMHLGIRIVGMRLGSEAGLEVGRYLRDVPFQRIIELASGAACVFVGSGVVLAAAPALRDPVAAVAVVAAVLVGVRLGPYMRTGMVALLTCASILALLLGLAGYGN